jgi:ribulose-5-phosphate 4-epimerase/fuculose-1-phosphate aldolase
LIDACKPFEWRDRFAKAIGSDAKTKAATRKKWGYLLSPEATLADTLGDRLAVLMPHHGITTVGRDVGEAVAAATHLERACHIALLAGEQAIASPDEEALQKRERSYRHLSMAWTYLARSVGHPV